MDGLRDFELSSSNATVAKFRCDQIQQWLNPAVTKFSSDQN